ncbi:hypothetical protein PBP221_83540 (plasmid) [Paraburkholderia sp. 22B1P]|jgi:hypothetical protein|nr:hypothetical protein PBP221_83540 [Paraburkholderia sp. 22B1P]
MREARFVATDKTVPASGAAVQRNLTAYAGDTATRVDDAFELAMQFGKDIVDGDVQAVPI